MYLSDNQYPTQHDTIEQQQLYRYIRDLAHLSDQEAIDRFYRLLWDGNAYPNKTVHNALKTVVMDSSFEQQGVNLINRCYYTLANPWHLNSTKGDALTQLILRLEDMPSGHVQNRVTRKLRHTLQTYREDERYFVLKKHLRLVDVLNGDSSQGGDPQNEAEPRYFGDLFQDYFFLYEAGTSTPDINRHANHLNEGILQKRNQKLRQFQQELSQFYVRSHRSDVASGPNSTHLSNQDLLTAIKFYRPKRQSSFKTQATQFKANTRHIRVVGEFKQVVHDHIMQPIRQLGPRYRRLFDQMFQSSIDGFPPDMPLNRIVQIQLFSRLLKTILQGRDAQSGSHVYTRLVHELGPSAVTSFLLNLVLSCEMVRFELEKRLAYLHHQFFTTENAALQWLMTAFDHMNVALALNAKYLGYFNLSFAQNTTIPDSM
ncbi:MAG: hypothetical protein F6K09_02405 [Merismopedia sp. SIO2A8]|nr:hypothetical protein [Symploca sp. SIO2B6]NET47580.1 hypothetical protein [Merismopedia sp. SIO2A8]